MPAAVCIDEPSEGARSRQAATLRPRQLTLAFGHLESFAREDFLSGPSNRSALETIERWPQWPSPAMVLVGPEGSGKSHLAAIWAQVTGARIAAARSLDPLSVPAALATGALALEDLASQRFDERALFHLLNLAREEGASLLLTTRAAPSFWQIELPDLASRLRALPTVELAPPDDALLRAVIVKLFADRQLAVDEGLVSFVGTRIVRSFAGARHAVEALDREAMQLKRPVTRALAGEVLRLP